MSQVPSGLHGKLEELGLDEILQIIGISRRTGILTLTSQGREAVLYIRDGLLVRISSTGIQQKLHAYRDHWPEYENVSRAVKEVRENGIFGFLQEEGGPGERC